MASCMQEQRGVVLGGSPLAIKPKESGVLDLFGKNPPEEDPYVHPEYRVARRTVKVQADTFLDAFDLRYGLKIPDAGRENFHHLAASGKLKTIIKYALAQPMAALTRYGIHPVEEFPTVPKGYQDYAGYDRFLIMDVLKLNSTQRYRLYSHLTETKTVSGIKQPTLRAIKYCFELTQMKNICPRLTFQEVVDSIRDHHDTLTDGRNPEVEIDVERIVDHLAPVLFPHVTPLLRMPPGKLTDRAALLEHRFTGSLATLDESEETYEEHPIEKLKSGSGFRARVSDPLTEGLEAKCNRMATYSLGSEELLDANFHPKFGVQPLYSRPLRSMTEDEIMEPYLDTEQYPIKDNVAQVVALLEPLKVRTISIDSGILRYMASRIQQWLWNTISSYRPFELIKGTLVEDTVDYFYHGLGFVSGDYKGATDSIFHNSTDLWVKQIFSRIAVPPHLEGHIEAIKRDFTRVLLDYRNTYDQEGIPFIKALRREMGFADLEESKGNFHEVYNKLVSDCWNAGLAVPNIHGLLSDNCVVRQARGQLMGNVLSFPILCLINLTGYLVSVERYVNELATDLSQGFENPQDGILWNVFRDFVRPETVKGRTIWKISLNKKNLNFLPVRVNGDDILFQASPFFYRVWSYSLRDVGFVKSVGKNYYSEFFLTVNSQVLVPRHTIERFGDPYLLSPVRINHIWWSGLTPDFLRRRTDFSSIVGKSMARIADCRAFLAPVQQIFLETVPQRKRSLWNRLFLTNNEEFISSFDSIGKPINPKKKGDKCKKDVLGHFRVSRSLRSSWGDLVWSFLSRRTLLILNVYSQVAFP